MGNAGNPVGPVARARPLVTISKEMLGRQWRFESAKPAHLDWWDLVGLAGFQRAERCTHQRFVVLLVLNEDVP